MLDSNFTLSVVFFVGNGCLSLLGVPGYVLLALETWPGGRASREPRVPAPAPLAHGRALTRVRGDGLSHPVPHICALSVPDRCSKRACYVAC